MAIVILESEAEYDIWNNLKDNKLLFLSNILALRVDPRSYLILRDRLDESGLTVDEERLLKKISVILNRNNDEFRKKQFSPS